MDNPVQLPVELGTTLFTKVLSLMRSLEKLQRDKDGKPIEVSAESPKQA